MKIGIVVPHIFMHEDILPHVIFSPAKLAIDLAEGLHNLDESVTLFTPGPVETTVNNITADLSYFEQELSNRNDGYLDLLKKHPFTFITLARQVQSELIAKAYDMANQNQFDLVHLYTNEEDLALPFAKLCKKPVVFTHHDPFNFLVKYKNVFPKYADLNWISLSLAQRKSMPQNTNWVANIYHGLDKETFKPNYEPNSNYVAFLGRIIEPKGLHLAIETIKAYNQTNNNKLKLKIAGKHYADHKKDNYWQTVIKPQLDNQFIEYVGFINSIKDRQAFLGNASVLLMPSLFDEPFGMVMIEALACASPVIGLDSGAIPEIISNQKIGKVIKRSRNDKDTIIKLAEALGGISSFDRHACRAVFEQNFTLERMCQEHATAYRKLVLNNN